jgi:acetyltransferase
MNIEILDHASQMILPANVLSDRRANASQHPLEVFFHPKRVAVIGATDRPGSPGQALMANLISRNANDFEVFAVNPLRAKIADRISYPSICDVPGEIDLAIIVTPANTVPDIISECVSAGVRGVIVISAGFREFGETGKELERKICERIQGSQLRVIGPNCIGVMNPVTGLNATFARKSAHPGSVAFISQSGALCTAILDWSVSEALGFSAFVSTGSMLDVGWGDLIEYLGTDPATESIVIYMESIGDARSFLEAATTVAVHKPIIVIKAGRTEAAAKAAASHTGTMTGSDAVLDAAFRRAGVLRVDWIGDLFHIAEVLAKQAHPKGRRLAIVTNAGGPGVLAADALMLGGGELATLSQHTMDALDAILPAHWSRGNPIDILADASEETFERAVELAMHDEGCDGVLAITAPLVAARPLTMAKSIAKYADLGKPLLAAFMGGDTVSDAEGLMSRGGIPTFAFPDDAVRVFNYMWKYSENLSTLESATLPIRSVALASPMSTIIELALQEGRTVLTEVESKELLASFGIPVVPTKAAVNVEEAIHAARSTGFPVVVKLLSKTITHKSDIGGVRLNLHTEDDVRRAFDDIRAAVVAHASAQDFCGVSVQPMVRYDGFELILGSSIDAQFGPVILFGAGGVFAEVMKDAVLELPPLNQWLARRMIDQTQISRALKGVRGRAPINSQALESVLINFSNLILDQPWISEIDINPLIASSEGCLALDARVLLHDAATPIDQLPRAAMNFGAKSARLA